MNNLTKLMVLLSVLTGCFSIAMAQIDTVETPLQWEAMAKEGAEYRAIHAEAIDAINKKNRPLAEEKLNSIIMFCESRQSSGSLTVVSVANLTEFSYFMSTLGKDAAVSWIDMACPAAYQMLAFLNIDAGEVESALRNLDRAIEMAPLWAEPLTERGYIMNKLGKPGQAAVLYEKAIKLADQFESSRHLKPIALRGLGFSLIESGDLDGAQKAFEESLVLEPENENARGELIYIEQLRATP